LVPIETGCFIKKVKKGVIIVAIRLKERPIFIIGAPRSGTTLMMVMLGCHPRIAIPEVGHYYNRFRPYLYTYGDLSNDENLRVLIEEMVFGQSVPLWGMRISPGMIVEEVLSEVKEQSFAGVYCAMTERYAREVVGKPRWGQKSPENLFFVKQIKEDFPNAQFIFLIRDGRDASADFVKAGFGPTNIFCAAEYWKLCQNFVKPWRKKLSVSEWMDVRYETLVKEPEKTLKQICDFLEEKYYPLMLEFYKTDIARKRSFSPDHKPLSFPITDKYVGVYKELLSLKEQQIFASVTGRELEEAGYLLDVEPAKISKEEMALYRELDGRMRAAVLDAPRGAIVHESFNDWLTDQREERKKRGIWKDSDIPKEFPIGHLYEEVITGYNAPKKWKKYFCVKRQYYRPSDKCI
jgi:hypothetical protein